MSNYGWIASLMTNREVVVHAMDLHERRTETNTPTVTRVELATPCGQVAWVCHEGAPEPGYSDVGVQIALGQAERLHSRPCRHCFPDGWPS